MKFVEIAIPRNADSLDPERPERVLINLSEILDIVVSPVSSLERDKTNTHALILRFPLFEIELQGTKLECDEGYQALCDILNSKKAVKGSKFVVSPIG